MKLVEKFLYLLETILRKLYSKIYYARIVFTTKLPKRKTKLKLKK